MRKQGAYESGIGLGRLGKPELFGEGLYRLFYLSSMKLEFRTAALASVEGKKVEPENTSQAEETKDRTDQVQITVQDLSENNQLVAPLLTPAQSNT